MVSLIPALGDRCRYPAKKSEMQFRLQTLLILVALSAFAVWAYMAYANWLSLCYVDRISVDRILLPIDVANSISNSGENCIVAVPKRSMHQPIILQVSTKARTNNQQSCTFASTVMLQTTTDSNEFVIGSVSSDDIKFSQFAGLRLTPTILQHGSMPKLNLSAELTDETGNTIASKAITIEVHPQD